MALYVTDTHPLVWYAGRHYSKLSTKALRIFQDADRERLLVYVPAVVVWEITLLAHANRIRLQLPVDEWANALLARGGFELVPLDLPIAVEAGSFGFHNDPFDAAIVATAQVKDLPLITKDNAITRSGRVEIAW